jgi:hypothetical protein
MAKYRFDIIYTTSKRSKHEIEAESEGEARWKAMLWFVDQDTNNWSDCGDADIDVDVEKVED